MTFPTETVYPKDGSKKNGLSILAKISRGQTGAHEVLQWALVVKFYAHYPNDCSLRVRSNTTATAYKECLTTIIATGRHKTSPGTTTLGMMLV